MMNVSNFKIFQEERPWGNFRQFTHNTPSTVKIITINPNEILSLQSHAKRSEFWKFLKGDGVMEVDGVKYTVKEDDEFSLAVLVKHRLSAGSLGLVVLEIATGEFEEKDIVRYEDKYGRV